MFLKNRQDWQSIFYLILFPTLITIQWLYGIQWYLYLIQLFLTLGIGVIHHNHNHKRMWKVRCLNRMTDFWVSTLQGHPSFVFHPAHNGNHHRYRHSAQDVARTYRFGGDTNHLIGYLMHPLQAALILYPLFFAWLKKLHKHHRKVFYYCLSQYLCVFIISAMLASIDTQKWLFLVLIPQLHGLHWLLATNYLQHAHADGNFSDNNNRYNYARNFEGWVNPLLFNIGLHTAHHEHPRAHWSELKKLHQNYKHRVDPSLNEKGLLLYMTRVYILSIFVSQWRSISLMKKI